MLQRFKAPHTLFAGTPLWYCWPGSDNLKACRAARGRRLRRARPTYLLNLTFMLRCSSLAMVVGITGELNIVKLPAHKTKIVCTIGPASESVHIIEQMIRAGMNVARLNFSHGDFAAHEKRIGSIRKASEAAGMPVAIMADLPGPKMRIGQLASEPVELEQGSTFTLTTEDTIGDEHRASVTFPRLPHAVKKGDALFSTTV